jgi:hypothetical protein
MIIGIIGYFTVPSVANYIVHAGGGNALLHKVSSVFTSSASSATQSVVQGGVSMVKDVYGNAPAVMNSGMAAGSAVSNYFKDKISGGSA